MCAVALRQSRWGVSRVHGAIKAAVPGYIEPCDPTLREKPPRGEDWVYEIKADGYRAQLHLQDEDAKVYSRNGLDWTEQFSSIAAGAHLLKANSAIIDGEAVVYGLGGLPDFQQLRRELGPKQSERVRYHAFDLLYLDGYDLRAVVYEDRKRLLERLLKDAPETFIYVEALAADGNEVFEEGCKLGLEGLIAKRLGEPYRSGRQETWAKLKCKKSETFPIVAFVEKLGARPRKVASLYVGRRENGQLLYAGKVRTGYTETTARELRERLDPLIRKTSPLDVAIKKPKATWVDPTVAIEVQYGALTDDGLLREAVFKGFRDDLAVRKVKAPRLVPSVTGRPKLGVPRENILQLLPEAAAPSKEELADYWTRVWKKALPHLGHRPLKLVRHVHGTTFYHKGSLPKDIPAAVHQLRIQKREGGQGTRLWVDSLNGFLGLVEIGAVELHPWNATVEDFEYADRIVIDLDPGEGVDWDAVVETALDLRNLMKREGFETWPKLTGGKGIHLMAPLDHPVLHDKAHRVAHQLVTALAARHPDRYLLSAQAKRRDRIFLDYLRNGRGTTAIGTYSPRAREGFPIAAPVTWKRIESGIAPDAFTIHSPFRAK
ncbi:DNA ligase D [Bradyrhizobium sp. 182]|uniref:DNA ligase D n=1 Tax=unclassified Bradyrhizobium TaxID=2631580 RepID=UPI001FF73213|nr:MULTISPECIES: DNA ligase D [unclassified Bradyrhizobium]MCK1420272.1 DNA ligase D [Bradyrhizobium sp. CW12]MCK1527550.1 DNA ligase D [Bradyrhizobium sp. 182]MCK1646788.1 DNA ligase D [Bradyrhizobium sp. 154]